MNANADSYEQVIDNLATGTRLVASLPLTVPPTALSNIQQILDSLKAHPPTPDIYLDVLEQLRHPLRDVMAAQAPLYRDRPLPLLEHGEGVFQQVTGTLDKMSHGYDYCAQFIKNSPHDKNDPEFVRLLALALHRSLYYASQFVFEHYYARQELPPGIWQEVHHYYAEAEQHDLTERQVIDTLDSELTNSTCVNLYVALLLVEITNPYSYDARDQGLIFHWALLWASLVSVFPVESVLDIPPVIIDLAQDKPLHPASNSIASNNARLLDTFGLTAQLNETRETLASKSISVELKSLRLGDTSTGHARRLLAKLTAPWGLSVSPRRFQRYGGTHGQAKVCSSFEHIHRAVSGEDFRQPGAFEALPVLGASLLGHGFDTVESVATSGRWRRQQVSNLPTSTWDVINYSANGFRLFRSVVGLQIAHSQLLALCQDNTPHYLLGEARWLMQDDSEGCLHMGVTMFPGIPQAVAVRPEDLLQGAGEPYLRAFMLPGLEKTKTPPTLILPIGLYRPQRSLSLAISNGDDDGSNDDIQTVTLDKLWQRGLDFEIVTYNDKERLNP
jgi:hypothetical protein